MNPVLKGMVSPNESGPYHKAVSGQKRAQQQELTVQTELICGLTRLMKEQDTLLQEMVGEYEHAAVQLVQAHETIAEQTSLHGAAVHRLQNISTSLKSGRPMKTKDLLGLVNDVILSLNGNLVT